MPATIPTSHATINQSNWFTRNVVSRQVRKQLRKAGAATEENV
jgi:hypothetical protein